jgi:hypothetical protein
MLRALTVTFTLGSKSNSAHISTGDVQKMLLSDFEIGKKKKSPHLNPYFTCGRKFIYLRNFMINFPIWMIWK